MTALQTLIHKWETSRDIITDESSKVILTAFINDAKTFLETEKQQIVDARENGRQVEYEHHFINDDNNISSNQYYNQLINKEKWISENKFKKNQLKNY